jgi:hypothetical protein
VSTETEQAVDVLSDARTPSAFSANARADELELADRLHVEPVKLDDSDW